MALLILFTLFRNAAQARSSRSRAARRSGRQQMITVRSDGHRAWASAPRRSGDVAAHSWEGALAT